MSGNSVHVIGECQCQSQESCAELKARDHTHRLNITGNLQSDHSKINSLPNIKFFQIDFFGASFLIKSNGFTYATNSTPTHSRADLHLYFVRGSLFYTIFVSINYKIRVFFVRKAPKRYFLRFFLFCSRDKNHVFKRNSRSLFSF